MSQKLLDEIRFDSDAGDNLTIREYLHALLDAVWVEEESFSGKRPFGNSGWHYDLYAPLVKAGAIQGKLDSDGCLEDVDAKEGEELVRALIKEMCFGRGPD